MCIRAYIAASYVNHMTRLHIGQVVLEGPEWLCDFLLLLLFVSYFGLVFGVLSGFFFILGFFEGSCFLGGVVGGSSIYLLLSLVN